KSRAGSDVTATFPGSRCRSDTRLRRAQTQRGGSCQSKGRARELSGHHPSCRVEDEDDTPIFVVIGQRGKCPGSPIAHEYALAGSSEQVCPGKVRPAARMPDQPGTVEPRISGNRYEECEADPALLRKSLE